MIIIIDKAYYTAKPTNPAIYAKDLAMQLCEVLNSYSAYTEIW